MLKVRWWKIVEKGSTRQRSKSKTGTSSSLTIQIGILNYSKSRTVWEQGVNSPCRQNKGHPKTEQRVQYGIYEDFVGCNGIEINFCQLC